MSMKVKKVEESAKPANPVQVPAKVAPIPIGPPLRTPYPPAKLNTLASDVNSFKFFECKVAVIQAEVSKTQEEINEDERLQQWLHSFTVFNDTCTVSNDDLAPERVERRLVKGKIRSVRVNQIRACWLQQDDSWGDHEDTKQHYLDRNERSAHMRKRSKVGHLQLVHSKPKYPDPWPEPRPEISELFFQKWKAAKARHSVGKPHLKMMFAKVQKSEFCGPPNPLKLAEYPPPVDWEFDSELLLSAPSDFISKAYRFNMVGHCEVAKPVPWAYRRRTKVDDVMYVKQAGYPAETIMSPPTDDARYDLYWDHKHQPKVGCNLIELITKPSLNDRGVARSGMTWEIQRSLTRRKRFLSLRTDNTPEMPLFESSFKKSRRKIALVEPNRLLPLAIAVGKPYGGYSLEEKIALVRFKRANGILVRPLDIIEVSKDSEAAVDYVDPDTTDVHLDGSVCRVLGDTPEPTSSEWALAVFESSNDERHERDSYTSELSKIYLPEHLIKAKYFQLRVSGIWLPKRLKSLYDYSPLKTTPVDRPSESEATVKSSDDSEPVGTIRKIYDWITYT